MFNYIIILVAGFLLNFNNISFSQGNISPQQEPLKAKIEILQEVENQITILGKFYNNTDSSFSVYYEMESNKISPSGKSISKQSGKPLAKAHSELILTKVGLNVDSETTYNISLKVFRNHIVISSDSLNYIPEKK